MKPETETECKVEIRGKSLSTLCSPEFLHTDTVISYKPYNRRPAGRND